MTDVITRTQTQLVELDFDIAELSNELATETDADTAEELSNTLAAYREVREEFENRLQAAINGEDAPPRRGHGAGRRRTTPDVG